MTRKERQAIIAAAKYQHDQMEICTEEYGMDSIHAARHRCAWCALEDLMVTLGIKDNDLDFGYMYE